MSTMAVLRRATPRGGWACPSARRSTNEHTIGSVPEIRRSPYKRVDGVGDQLDTELNSQAYGGHVMRSLRAMIRKEFIHLRRNPNVVAFTIGLPVVLVLLFGYALRLKVDRLPGAGWGRG